MCWTRQKLYFSERTSGSSPNTLVISDVKVMSHLSLKKERHRVESIEKSFVKKSKVIIHPGEVCRIREVPTNKNIVATHTDSPNVLIWDVKTQSNREPVIGAAPSRPDLILTGHQNIAQFALATCHTEPFVLSGGKDKSVVLWSLNDHVSSLAANDRPTEGTTVGARGVFQGHENTVEDVHFNKSSSQEFCSVGDDSCLILWDARTGYSPAVKAEKAHYADVHCVNWNPHDVNLILTGSADNTIRMYDRRNLTSRRSRRVGVPVHIFDDHSAAIMCVEWYPAKASIFGSAAEDGFVNIWDHEQVGNRFGSETSSDSPGLIFKHEGHSPYRGKVVDFQWNKASPFTIASVAENEKMTGGGTLQIWRPSDIFWPREVI